MLCPSSLLALQQWTALALMARTHRSALTHGVHHAAGDFGMLTVRPQHQHASYV